MTEPSEVASHILACFDECHRETHPFRHWLLEGVLPDATCAAIDVLPFSPPEIADILGKNPAAVAKSIERAKKAGRSIAAQPTPTEQPDEAAV